MSTKKKEVKKKGKELYNEAVEKVVTRHEGRVAKALEHIVSMQDKRRTWRRKREIQIENLETIKDQLIKDYDKGLVSEEYLDQVRDKLVEIENQTLREVKENL